MYERFFGLVDAPFRLTPDPRYLFLSQKHAEALAHLKLGLSESSGFVCITGEVGTGKTTLLRSFLTGLGRETSSAYIFNPVLSALELLQTINAELGIPSASDSRKALVDALNAHLLAQREAGRRSIVVIDEAQALSIDVLEQLRLLSNLETTTEKLLRIVLVGQPQLRTLLTHPELAQLNQRMTLRWHMGPLSYRETVAYMRHRLAVASGGEQSKLFTRAAIWQVHRLSGGVPRLINMIAHRAMVAAYAADRHTVGVRSVLRAYREIGALPLPSPTPRPRRVVWAATGTAAAIALIALGLPRLAALPSLHHSRKRPAAVAPPDTPAEPTDVVAEAAPPGPDPTTADADAPVEIAAVSPSDVQADVPTAPGADAAPAQQAATDAPPAPASPPAPDPAVAAPSANDPPAGDAAGAPGGDAPAPAAEPPAAPAPAVAAAATPAPEPVKDVAAAATPSSAPAVAAPAGEAIPAAPAPTPVATPDPPAAPAPNPPAVVAAVAPAAPTTADMSAAVERRLAVRDPQTSARAAVEALLAAWHARPLDTGEGSSIAELSAVATRRGFESLPLVGNGSMLRLLDLPAVLELRLPAAQGPRYATVTGVDGLRATLTIDGQSMSVDESFLDRNWFGQAYLLWRDFEALGPAVGPNGRGPGVARLQALLARAGSYRGPVSGTFDAATAAAVVAFQRSRFLVPDGRVGKLTRIVLYAAAGGYPRPMLSAPRDGAS